MDAETELEETYHREPEGTELGYVDEPCLADAMESPWPMRNIQVVHNTSTGNFNGVRVSEPAGMEGVTIANNIFDDNEQSQFKLSVVDHEILLDGGTEIDPSRVLYDHNISYCSIGVDGDGDGYLDCMSQADLFHPIDSIIHLDPMLAPGAFTFPNTSPAVDSAVGIADVVCPTHDIHGRARDSSPDLGAWEARSVGGWGS